MQRLRNIVSFLYPIKVESKKGNVTSYLEVMQHNGKYVLNSENANYSFGGLHTIFDSLFKKIDINSFKFSKVLILGMGAGSIISLLLDKYKCNCHITAIEKDEVIIEFAKKYFNIEKHNQLTIINTDAFEYAKTTHQTYDLIISDLFIDNDVPAIFATTEYLENLKRISNKCSCMMYNKMTEDVIHKKEVVDVFKKFALIFPGSEIRKCIVNDSENSVLYYNTLPILNVTANTKEPMHMN
jgi:phospholipid N-methyltransferase